MNSTTTDTRETYNGWTNYATWRVNLEIVSDYASSMADDYPRYNEPFDMLITLADHLKDMVEETIDSEDAGTLAASYALAFVSQVNWYELAESVATDYPQIMVADQD